MYSEWISSAQEITTCSSGKLETLLSGNATFVLGTGTTKDHPSHMEN